MYVQGFDSMEEAFAEMRRAEEEANDRVTSQQRAITFGSCWMRPMGPAYDHVVVFGRVQTMEELVASEVLGVSAFVDEDVRATAMTAATDLIAELRLTYGLSMHEVLTTGERMSELLERLERFGDEAGWTLESVAERYVRGYRFGRAWSVMEPRGEFGDTHVSEMVPLSREEFEDASHADWSFGAMLRDDELRAEWAVRMVLSGSTMRELAAREV